MWLILNNDIRVNNEKIVVIFFVYAQKELPVISKVEELKTVKVKKIIWRYFVGYLKRF